MAWELCYVGPGGDSGRAGESSTLPLAVENRIVLVSVDSCYRHPPIARGTGVLSSAEVRDLIPRWVRKTSDDKVAGVIRRFLGVLFLMTGAMKLLVPRLSKAWSGQLQAADIPFYTFNLWAVPVVEIFVELCPYRRR
jgi:hypothetical protein